MSRIRSIFALLVLSGILGLTAGCGGATQSS